jgi:hypothetical protein
VNKVVSKSIEVVVGSCEYEMKEELFAVVRMLVWGFGSGEREGQHDDTCEWRYGVVVGGRRME